MSVPKHSNHDLSCWQHLRTLAWVNSCVPIPSTTVLLQNYCALPKSHHQLRYNRLLSFPHPRALLKNGSLFNCSANYNTPQQTKYKRMRQAHTTTAGCIRHVVTLRWWHYCGPLPPQAITCVTFMAALAWQYFNLLLLGFSIRRLVCSNSLLFISLLCVFFRLTCKW